LCTYNGRIEEKARFVQNARDTFKSFINNTIERYPNEREPLPDAIKTELQSRIVKVEEVLDAFYEIQQLIIEAGENEENIAETTDAFENNFHEVVARAKLLLNRGIQQSNNNVEQSGLQFPNSVPTAAPRSVKLSTIDLPKFDGNLNNWLGFRDIFELVIHSSNTIPKILKFQYLKLSVSGTAREEIGGLQLSEDNYDNAWKALTDRYNNKNQLIHNHIKQIYDFKSINLESSSQLLGLNDTITKNLRSLKLLGQRNTGIL